MRYAITLRALLRLVSVPRWRLAWAVLLGALTVVFGVGLMATSGYLISRAAERPPILSLVVTIVAVQFFGIGRPLVRYLERLASHDMTLRVLGRLRARFFARIEPLAPAELDAYRKGDLLSRMVADVDALQNLYLRGLEPPLVALLAGAVSVGASVALLPSAGLVLAGGLLVGGLAVPALAALLGTRAGRRQAAARGQLSAELIESLRGAPELVAFGADEAALDRVRAADRVLVKLARRDALTVGLGDGLELLVTGLTVAGVLAVAIVAHDHGALNRVLIATLALLALAAFEAVTPLAATARDLSTTLAAGRRVLELTDHTASVQDPARPAAAPQWPFAVALEDVTARYPREDMPAVAGVNLRLEAGERVALLGPSGAGKTTVANLLLRFLDPSRGQVTMAGKDLRDYRQADVRRAISVAGQDSHLFSASIRDNVRLARPDASDDDLRDALRRARIWDWICTLPDGLDTFVGEEGREVSGGQRQRIALARALVAGAPVLVLDEPTAHLDARTASELIDDVFSAAGDRTVLLITHRTEGLDLVDRAVTL
ncbi:MAG: thiol reductant ABC exporter subunit CydC [Solirubrobacteraceae bacterium]